MRTMTSPCSSVFNPNGFAAGIFESSSAFLCDGWNPLRETAVQYEPVSDGTGLPGDAASSLRPAITNTLSYLWGLDLSGTFQGAGGVGGLLAVTDSENGTSYPTYDANGNVSEYVSQSGTVLSHYDYSPFGELLISTAPHPSPFRFSTKHHDPETDTLYYGYRHYSPRLGRWLSRDPLEEESDFENLYLFVGNLPTIAIDGFGDRSLLSQNLHNFSKAVNTKVSDIGIDGTKEKPTRKGKKPKWKNPKSEEENEPDTVVKSCNVRIETGHNTQVPQWTIGGEPCSAWALYSCGETPTAHPALPQQSPGLNAPTSPRRGQISSMEAVHRLGMALIRSKTVAEEFCRDKNPSSGCCSKVRVTTKCHHIGRMTGAMYPLCNKPWTFDCENEKWEPVFPTSEENVPSGPF